MDLGVRNAVWDRDKGICQRCGKKLIERARDVGEKQPKKRERDLIFVCSIADGGQPLTERI